MNDQFIQSVQFDWNKIDDNSYLKEIDAFRGAKGLIFTIRLPFLWEKMEAGNPHCWKRLQ